ncbi:MAG: glycosyltransferase family 39 protein [Bacteroidetes bacterium]|nr:glycosyltransferase family 39 protein [Bacteroidota bacterium]
MFVFVFGLFLRLSIAFRDITTIDRYFIPDDTYYTLALTRSLAEGKGPTIDGIIRTNGFQPLLAFLLVPFAKITTNPDTLLRIDIILLSFIDSGIIVLLGLLAKRIFYNSPNYYSLAIAFAWSISSVGISNALGGLETSLAVCLVLLFVEIWLRAIENTNNRLYIFAGIIAGCSLLARIDTCFTLGIIGFYELVSRKRIKQLFITVITAIIVVSPWWLYQIVYFNTIIPESGEAVQTQAYLHQIMYLKKTHQVAWAFGTLLDFLTGELFYIRSICFQFPYLTSVLFLVTTTLFIIFLIKKIINTENGAPIFLYILSAFILCWFYALYVPAVWFFTRYLATTQTATLLLLVVGIKKITNYTRTTAVIEKCFIMFTILFSAFNVYQNINYLFVTPTSSKNYGLLGAKGYRLPALQILSQAPINSVIGAFQSGALSYYAPIFKKNITIINLDGVVNGESAQALKNYKLSDYARKRKLTHFADWEFNKYMFILRSGEPGYIMSILTAVGFAEPQYPAHIKANDYFVLYELKW